MGVCEPLGVPSSSPSSRQFRSHAGVFVSTRSPSAVCFRTAVRQQRLLRGCDVHMFVVNQEWIVLDVAHDACSSANFFFGGRCCAETCVDEIAEIDFVVVGGAGDGVRFGALTVVEGYGLEDAHLVWAG